MPRYNRNYLYDGVVLAYIAENNDGKISLNSIVDEIGFSKTTIVHTIRRLTSQGRLAIERKSVGRGKLFNYEIKIPPTKSEKNALKLQREIKKAAGDSPTARPGDHTFPA